MYLLRQMSLYVDDPMHFISGRLPPELTKYITLEEWQEIVDRLMRCEQNGNFPYVISIYLLTEYSSSLMSE